MRFFLISIFIAISISYVRPQNVKSNTIDSVLSDINQDSIRSIIQSLQDFGTRFSFADNNKDVAMWIKNKFISYGYTSVELDSFLVSGYEWPSGSGNYYTRWQYNVIATINGNENPEEILISGAHYDSFAFDNSFFNAPGADDNASGTAAVLETSRVILSNNIIPKKTIKFIAFVAEEIGLIGSYDYVQKAVNNNLQIKMMINSDMISYTNLPQEQWKINLQNYPGAETVTSLAIYITSNYTNLDFELNSDFIQNSDSYPFYVYGYPAIFLHEIPFNINLHTIYDIIDSVNINYCTEITKVSCGMLLYDNLVNSIYNTDTNSKFILFQNQPNPSVNYSIINYFIPVNSDIIFILSDTKNRILLQNNFSDLSMGEHKIELNLSDVEQGIYFYTIKTKNYSETKKMIIVK